MDNENYLSECCDAPPLLDVNECDGDIMGECSLCKEWVEFYDSLFYHEDMIDWQDELEYIAKKLEDL